jgi:hypothetical protein
VGAVRFSVNKGVPNPWMMLGAFTVLLVIIFVADVSVTARRRGDKRKALIVGGSAELSPRTFWNFAGEFSSVRRQGAATGEQR